MSDAQKYPALQIVRGGRYGRTVRVRTAKEIELDERMRRAFGRCTPPKGGTASPALREALKDIQKGKQKPWSKLAQRAVEMDEAGMPPETIKATLAIEFANWLDGVLSKPKRAA